jgi:CRISPR/Cas system-associated exonuclease Cas4 (RecB family)
VERLPFEAPKTVLAGRDAHENITFEHDKEAIELTEPLETRISKIMKKKAAPISIRSVLVESKTFGLRGEIDELEASYEEATIIDDKPGAWVPFNIKKQVWAYALAFKDHFDWKPKIFCAVRSYNEDKIVWRQEFSAKAEEEIISTTQRINDILDKKREPIPTEYPQKCARCSYATVCPKSRAEKGRA